MTNKPAPKVPPGAPVANGPAPGSPGPQLDDRPAVAGADVGQAEVQAQADTETAQGYRGTKADPTPDAAYTVAGQLAGTPTPEAPAPKERA